MHLAFNTDSIKQFNFNLIYRVICQNAPISRIQLAELTQLAPASITKIIRDLLNLKLIQEVETQQSTGGRPAISIKPLYDHYQVIAIKLSRSHFTLELYDLGAQKLAKTIFQYKNNQIYAISQNTINPKQIEQLLIEQIEIFRQQYHLKIKQLLAFSVVLPGVIHSKTQTILYSPHLHFDKPWQLGQRLSDQFKLPALIGNDVQSLALAESFFGVAQNQADFILIRTHHGVGSGIILNHQLLNTAKQSNSEIGHIQIDALGELCHCGHFGCLETKISDDSLIRIAAQKIKAGFNTNLTLEQLQQQGIVAIYEAIQKQDYLAICLIQQASHNLGQVLATLVNIFNPESIVIAGTFAKTRTVALPAIRQALIHYALPQFNKDVELKWSNLNDDSAIGAFSLVRQALFESDFIVNLKTDC